MSANHERATAHGGHGRPLCRLRSTAAEAHPVRSPNRTPKGSQKWAVRGLRSAVGYVKDEGP